MCNAIRRGFEMIDGRNDVIQPEQFETLQNKILNPGMF